MKYDRLATLAVALLLALKLPTPGSAPAMAQNATQFAAPGRPAKASLIDINSASEAELDAVPQIGPARAKAIIAGRPYQGKDDLVSRRIVSQGVYEKIRDKIIARQ